MKVRCENWRLLKTGNENFGYQFQGDGSKATFTTPQMIELTLEL
jgi:hypothetical protein